MSRIRSALVTGGSGFIGTTLVRQLLADGTRVTQLVRSDSLREPQPGVTPVALGALAIDTEPCDVVFNLASYGVAPEDSDPALTVEGNVGALLRVIEAVRGWPLRRFVHVGSCSEYAPVDAPERITESHLIAPLSVYGAGKAAAHVMGSALARRHGVPLVTARLFGTYGPGEAPHRLIPYIATRLARDELPELTSGDQLRDFTHVDDVARALIACATSERVQPLSAYNVCSGQPARIRDVAELVARCMGRPVSSLGLGRRPLREGEPLWLVGDPGAFVRATDFRPEIALDAGVAATVEAVIGR